MTFLQFIVNLCVGLIAFGAVYWVLENLLPQEGRYRHQMLFGIALLAGILAFAANLAVHWFHVGAV